MFVAHKKGFYCQPHKHKNKSESFHLIEGEIKIIIFDDLGEILQVINMSTLNADGDIFFRLSKSYFHMVIIESELAIYHEVTNGPFDRKETLFADWAPSEDGDEKIQQQFISDMIINTLSS